MVSAGSYRAFLLSSESHIETEIASTTHKFEVIIKIMLKLSRMRHVMASAGSYRARTAEQFNPIAGLGLKHKNIPDICHFFYTSIFWGLKILHSKVRKFATRIVSRQNSVNHHSRAKFHMYFSV